jgi:glycosyltransferase involved in cell wall biosynthesis
MKVIHFIAGIDKGGGGTTEYMRLLSTALSKHMEIVVATKKTAHPIDIPGIRIKFFEGGILRWFDMLEDFRIFLMAEKPDIVHINGIWSPQNWGFQKVAQEIGIKVILSPHGMLEPWIMAHNPWKKRLGLFLYQKKAIQDVAFLHTTAEMEALNIQYLGFKPPISIIPNGIDLNDIKGIKECYGTKKMVFISRIHPKKGIELLLEAWRHCKTDGWQLEIAGNGDKNYIAHLSNSARDLKNVNFVGAKYGNEKWDFLRSADVMVLPTHSENFGIVIAEALALGVPVITTQGTPWEDLEIHECGWWINLSVPNLEKIITQALNTAAYELESMGRKGRRLVAEKYEIKAVANQMNDLYKKILN